MQCLQIIYFMDTVNGPSWGWRLEDVKTGKTGKSVIANFHIFFSVFSILILRRPPSKQKSSLNYWIHAHITKLSHKEGMTRKANTRRRRISLYDK